MIELTDKNGESVKLMRQLEENEIVTLPTKEEVRKAIKSIGKLDLKELRYDNIGDWIRCEDRMPPVGKTVLVTYYGSDLIVPNEGETVKDAIRRLRVRSTVTIATLFEDGEWCGPDGFPMMIQPMFWKSLPEPPICKEVD